MEWEFEKVLAPNNALLMAPVLTARKVLLALVPIGITSAAIAVLLIALAQNHLSIPRRAVQIQAQKGAQIGVQREFFLAALPFETVVAVTDVPVHRETEAQPSLLLAFDFVSILS